MNNVRKGYLRDRKIVRLVRLLGVLDTDQVASILFPMPTGLRKAQERLKTLYERRELKRLRLSLNEPYIYYTDRRPRQPVHRVTVSWAYCYLTKTLGAWERLEVWKPEDVCGSLRSDAIAGIRNIVTDDWRYVFVEADCSANPFNKVTLYNELYESQSYLSAWWAHNAKRFPEILVVTLEEGRRREIKRRIVKENPNRLRFTVRTVEEVKAAC